MSTHKNINRICVAAIIVALLLTIIFCRSGLFRENFSSTMLGYESRLFDNSKVHTIDIVMKDWDTFIQNCEDEEYVDCTVIVDKEAYKNVGIRAKGNTSLSSVSASGSDRYSFKIEFDQYQDSNTYYGLDKLSLNNVIQDNTYMKDYLTYQMMADFGVDAPLCSYVYITVNGEDWGLYLAVEGIEESFLNRNYGSNYGELYKPDSLSMGGGKDNEGGFNPSQMQNSNMPGGFDPSQLPEDFDPSQMFNGNIPEGFDPSQMQNGNLPEGFDPSQMQNGNMPEGFDPSQMQNGNIPEGFDPSQMQIGNMPEGFDPSQMQNGNMPEGFDPSQMQNGNMPEGFDPSQMPNGGAQSGDTNRSQSNMTSNDQTTNNEKNSDTQAQNPNQDKQAGNFDKSRMGGGFGGFGGMGSNDVKLQYIDDDPDSYTNIFDNAKTDISTADQKRLINSLQKLSKGEDIENVVNIEEVIRYFVVHNFVCNADSYTGSMIHNYYLYEDDGQLSMIPWDYNLAFGTFQSASDATNSINDPIDTPLSTGTMEDRPMIAWIYSNEEYTDMYHQYFSEFIDQYFTSGYMTNYINQTKEMIAPFVEKDPSKFCTYEEFEKGVTSIEQFCTLRAESVSGQLSGTIASTSNGQRENSDNLIDGSSVNISDMGTMNMGMGGDGQGFPIKNNTQQSKASDRQGNGMQAPSIDSQGNGLQAPSIDSQGNGLQDPSIDSQGNGLQDPSIDTQGNDTQKPSRNIQGYGMKQPPGDTQGFTLTTIISLIASVVILATGILVVKKYKR